MDYDYKKYDAQKVNDFIESYAHAVDGYTSEGSYVEAGYAEYHNNDTYIGKAADASKIFINKVQMDRFHLENREIQKELFKRCMDIKEMFKLRVDAAADAKIDTETLGEIKKDHHRIGSIVEENGYNLESIAKEIRNLYGKYGDVTIPNYRYAFDGYDEFSGSRGFIDKCTEKLVDFDDDAKRHLVSSRLKDCSYDLQTDIKATAGALEDMKPYQASMDKQLLNLIKLGTKGSMDTKKLDLSTILENLKNSKLFLYGMNVGCQAIGYDPVNLNNGNYLNDREDLNISGIFPLTVRRFYNALSDRSGLFGKGWTSLFDMHLSKEGEYDDSTITILFSDGHEGTYKRFIDKTAKNAEKLEELKAEVEEDVPNDSKYDPDMNEIEIVMTGDGRVLVKDDYENEEKEYLEEHGESGKLIEYRDYYRLIRDDGYYTEFDKEGKVRYFGNTKEVLAKIAYREDTPFNIASGLKYIELFYDEAGHIGEVKDNAGRSVKYEYSERGGEYFLTGVLYPDGSTRRYDYDADGIMNEVTNPVGTTFLKNEYDEKKRITKQSFPDGGVITYDYDEEKRITTATEQNGLKVDYYSDEYGRHVGTSYPEQGLKEEYTYNKHNQKISVTDRRGYTTRFSYDNRGHLTKVIDANGNITNITYNALGKPSVVKGPDGATYKYSYDDNGQLISAVNPLFDECKLCYNRFGQVEKIIDAEGAITYLRYDINNDICYVKDSKGVETFYERDELGRVISTKNALGAVTSYEYDVMDRISKVTDAVGNETKYFYNSSGKLIRMVNPDRTAKTWDYNNIGKPCEYTDEAGRKTRIKYNKVWDEKEVTLPNGGKICYEYDLLKRLIKITDPEHREVSYDYDENDNVIAQYNGDIKVRSFTYDAVGNISSETDALGHTKTYEYDANGNLIAVTDTLGNKYTREYDLLGNVTKETDALGNSTSYTYTKLGDIASVTDAAGRVKKFEYENGRLSAVYFCEKLEQKLDYDELGRIIIINFADGYKISYMYDPLNRIEKVEGSDGRTVSYGYDAMGRVVKVTDGESVTFYTYTRTGRLKSVVDALGNETAYTYDSLDNLKSIHRAEGLVGLEESTGEIFPTVGKDGHVTVYDYNLSGQLTEVVDALGQKEKFEYDQYGRLISKTDKDDYKTAYSYALDNQLSSIKYADGRSVELSYDALGRLAKFIDWLGVTEIERDILGRAISVTDYKGKKVSYTYGKTNERTSITYPNGKRVDYIYDDKLNLTELINGNKKTRYTYDELDRLIEKRLPNANREVMDYLPGGSLKSLELYDNNGLLDKYAYSYDTQGNRTEIDRLRRNLDEISGRYSYRYDLEKRLTSVSFNGEILRSYSYDAFGNRSSMLEDGNTTMYSYDVLDRLLEENNIFEKRTYSYDKRGNIAEKRINDALEKTFTYDATNMLTQVDDVSKGKASYNYNGLGKRVSAVNPTEKIDYLLDLTKDYHNMLERSVNGKVETYTYDSNVVSMSKEGQEYFYMHDELGTGMYLTGTDGMTVSSYAYDEFGRSLNPFTGKRKKPSYTKKDNIIQPLAFTGYQHDEMTDSYYAQARYYDARVGRFISRDNYMFTDIGNPESLNLYEYCFNSPIDFYDPSGNVPEWFFWVFGRGFEAHQFMQAYTKVNNENVETEFTIYGYVHKEDTNGWEDIKKRADIVFVDEETGIAEIYEIKPSTYDPNSNYYKEHEELKELGKIKNKWARSQLQEYVDIWPSKPENEQNTNCSVAIKGKSHDKEFKDVYFESTIHPGQYIHYYTGTGENQGLIFYEYIKEKPRRKISEVPADAKDHIKELFEEHIKKACGQTLKGIGTAVATLGLIIAGGFVAMGGAVSGVAAGVVEGITYLYSLLNPCLTSLGFMRSKIDCGG